MVRGAAERRGPDARVDPPRLRLFFVATLAWTWVVGMIPVVWGFQEAPLGTAVFYFGAGVAPSVVGLLLVFSTYPRAARTDYLRRCIPTWRGAWFVLLYAAALLTASTLAIAAVTGERPDFLTLQNPLMLLPWVFFIYLYGPVNEEFGWRGYALDELLVRFGFVRGNLLVGFIWGIWHLPWIFYGSQWQSQSLAISPWWMLVFVASTTATSFVIAIAYLLSGRNIFTAASVHAVSNGILGLFFADLSLEGQNVAIVTDIVLCTAVTTIVLVLFRRRFAARLRAELDRIVPIARGGQELDAIVDGKPV